MIKDVYNAKEKNISENISYIECTDDPLSADIGIIRTDNGVWLYDVGNDMRNLSALEGKYNVVLSHFHTDHVGCIERIKTDSLYISKETQKHIKIQGKIVEDDLYIDNLHIFPLRSSHAKGSLGLEVDENYAFVGDALYCRMKNGQHSYNAQLLYDEIVKLKSLKASRLLVSHHPGLLRSKDEVIAELEEIYSKHVPGNPEIVVSF